MTEFIWQLPNNRDARYGDATQRKRGERLKGDAPAFTAGVSDPRGSRFNYIDYLQQIARAADLTGFDGIRIQNDPQGDESWILAGVLARATRRLKILTEFDANRGSAVYAAKNAMSFQRFTRGRFAWQISSVSDPQLRKQLADKAGDDDLLPRIGEFLTVAKGVITQTGFNFKGRFFEVLEGGFQGPLSGQPVPAVYLSGDSAEAWQLSARQADVHVFDAQPASELGAKIAELKQLAANENRELRFGLRLDLLIREDREEAEQDAERLARQTEWTGSKAGDLWQGLGSGDAKGTLVGSYDEITEQLHAYAQAGISSFLLGGGPHLEEAYRSGENLLPRLRKLIGQNLQVA